MSKLPEIRNQYKCYKAAYNALEQIKPGTYKAQYGKDEQAVIKYDPGSDYITLLHKYGHIHIPLDDMPGLIKALTELCGETGEGISDER